MNDDPKREKQFPEKRSPRAVPIVNGVGNSCDNTDHVEDDEGGGRDEKSCPFEEVKISKLVGFVWGSFRRDGEVCVDAEEDFEETLKDCEEVSGDSSYHPELLVTPEVSDAHFAPPQLQDRRRNDW